MPSFVQAAAAGKVVTINFTETRMIDARFLGLLLMLEKHQKRQHLRLEFNGVSPRVAKLCRLNGFGFLFGG
jgi:N-acetylglucosaminyldiphosphoundecaprenol N-acetyl-beta-D-mannosaminyltransferase